MIGSLGLPEIVMIAVVALVVIGPKKLPEVAKMVGKTMRDFRKTVNEAKATIENEIDKVDMMKDLKEINEDFKSIKDFERDVKSGLKNMILPDNAEDYKTDINDTVEIKEPGDSKDETEDRSKDPSNGETVDYYNSIDDQEEKDNDQTGDYYKEPETAPGNGSDNDVKDDRHDGHEQPADAVNENKKDADKDDNQ